MQKRSKRRVLIGLTGGVATGKSTVAGVFRRLGIKTLDTDRIAHEVIKRPVVKRRVLKAFGTVDRKRLAGIVFAEKAKRKRLERILHPAIWKEVKKRARGLTIVEVPLLFEAGWNKKFDKIIVVTCKKKVQLKRCPALFRNRIKTQMPLSKKIKRADFVIDNSGTYADVIKRIKILAEWLWETKSLKEREFERDRP